MIHLTRNPHPCPVATARTAYHRACREHRGDPTIENTHAVRAAHAALESAKGGRHG